MGRRRNKPGIDPYKPDQSRELAAIDVRRLDLGVSVSGLAERAGLQLRKLYRMRASGRAWVREIKALKMALRSLERERERDDELFPGEEA